MNKIYTGDCKEILKKLPDKSVNCCITSPPYFGLRDYGTAVWNGGDPECKHFYREAGFQETKQATSRGNSHINKKNCPHCGAERIDKQIGLEETPEQYIAGLVEIFEEVRRILKPDGTLWLNIGDTYWGGKGFSGAESANEAIKRNKEGKTLSKPCSNIGGKGIIRPTDRKHKYIKPKDLIGIPWMLAFALRNSGWYLRQDIIWEKPNPMPESVKDRCTKSHEYIFLLSKSRYYYYDNEAIMEKAKYDGRKSTIMKATDKYPDREHDRWVKVNGIYMKNKRSVWNVPLQPFRDAHFAVYPETLIIDCVKAGSPENGIILDPFIGAGTTGVVALNLNRNFVGIELNADYVEIAKKRINRILEKGGTK
jgi:DNA modification methylase